MAAHLFDRSAAESESVEVLIGLAADVASAPGRSDDADGEASLFGEDPAVAPGSVADIDVGGVAPAFELVGRGGDFEFVGGAAGGGGGELERAGGDAGGAVGGEQPAGAFDAARGVDFDAVGAEMDGLGGGLVADGCAVALGGLGEVVVEAVAHGHPGDRSGRAFAEPGAPEAGDFDAVDGGFDDGLDVELEQVGGACGDAAAADFVSGEGLAFEQESAGAASGELPGGGGAGGSGADHDGRPNRRRGG